MAGVPRADLDDEGILSQCDSSGTQMAGRSCPTVLQGCGLEQDQQTQETGENRAAVQQGKFLLFPHDSGHTDLVS